jgi:hypothetical protein
VTTSPDNLANVAMRREMPRLPGRIPVAGTGRKRGEQLARLRRLLLVTDLLEDPQSLDQRGHCVGIAPALRLRLTEVLECLAVQRAGGPVLANRLLEAGDRFVKTVLD